MARQLFKEFFHAPPPELDTEAIWQQWQALQPPFRPEDRRPPIPVWARRSLTHNGHDAWAEVQQVIRQIEATRPFCIYLHVPFCAKRCAFCDCYAFHLKSHAARHIQTYINLLEREIALWSAVGNLAARPVSTIHLGGGTPTRLDPASFRRLIHACRTAFATNAYTEWALESTSTELTDEMFETLQALGFTRLHVGVQSLQDEARQYIHRRESAAQVIAKLERAISLGWVVTVDMIFGLPGQTLHGLINDLKLLASIGVDGFSLYELQISRRNQAFAEKHRLQEQPRLFNYFYALATGQLLVQMGYRKTLFNHFAGQRDTNLYFTFPERGEDCLALGTIADGMFANYHYRHPEYAAYCRGVTRSLPGLQGGLYRNALEERLHRLTTALLAARIPARRLSILDDARLLTAWQESALLVADPVTATLALTDNGSWFTGNMLEQLVRYESYPTPAK